MVQMVIFCCLAMLLGIAQSGEIDHEAAISYLTRFHYLGPSSPDSRMASVTDTNNFRKALMNLQMMGNITATGELDEETKGLMQLPRCGNADEINRATMTRRKRYALLGTRWNKNTLTYRIINYTPDLPRATTDREIKRAFQVWADQTPLSFRQIYEGTPDISIKFAVRYHGDEDDFDGPGGTLAHALFPKFGGDTHFDDSEDFTSETSRGVNLFQVAAHEFGHSLGLGHSGVRSALMAPFYPGYQRYFRLDNDDIEGIQRLYGPPTRIVPQTLRPTPQPTYPNPNPTLTSNEKDYCRDGQFDDLITLGNKVTYGFRGRYYYKLTSTGIAPGYPKLISQGLPGLPDNIDAAVSFPVYNFGFYINDEIWFFKGSQIYKYNSEGRAIDQPRSISSAIRYLPNNIDSAFVWSGDGMTYITKGNQYYRLNPRRDAVDPGYPQSTSVWGLNQGIDAACQYSNGKTYFFMGPNYYRFNDQNLKVDPNYPRMVSIWWYGC